MAGKKHLPGALSQVSFKSSLSFLSIFYQVFLVSAKEKSPHVSCAHKK